MRDLVTRRRSWHSFVIGSSLLAGAHALAQVDISQTVPTPDGRYRVALLGDQFILYDNAQARPLIGGSTSPIVMNTPFRPTITMEPKEYGADITFTYVNDSPNPIDLGWINIAGIRFPGNSKRWSFAQDTSTFILPGFNYLGNARYPQETYSPVHVMGDDRHTLGISLHYPIVEFDHNVMMTIVGFPTTTFGNPAQTWACQFKFEGTLPAGATRTYTVAIRATTADRSFLYTLTPYRDYFRSLYGPVDYVRDARPVSGSTMSQVEGVSPDNPRGYQNQHVRPDIVGWAPTVTSVVTARNFGYRRVMLWAPSGCLPASTGLNYPYRFMTPMNDIPVMRDSLSEFHRVREAGLELGFWWGNNSTLMRGWANPTAEGFNPNNEEHVRLAFAELDMAVSAGANLIGLDAYKQVSPRNMFIWLQMMKERAPNAKFVTENAAPDIIHNLSATFHEATGIRGPHVLADFLNPGHETWAAISSTPESIAANRSPTAAEMVREMNRVAALGFVPLVYGRPTIRTNMTAADSSSQTTPRDLEPPIDSPLLRDQQAQRRRNR
ncbi:MAG: hypothetical protein AB7K52_01685 [Phycisphaerales bacterium]